MRISFSSFFCAGLATALCATAVSAEDFNADGWGDNIAGHPFDDVSGAYNAGSVVVHLPFSHTEVLTQPPAAGVEACGSSVTPRPAVTPTATAGPISRSAFRTRTRST